MQKRTLANIILAASLVCLEPIASAYTDSGYADDFVDQPEFTELTGVIDHADNRLSAAHPFSSSYTQDPYDAYADSGEPEQLDPQLEHALQVDGISIDEYMGVTDAEGNYLGQADELYGLTLAELRPDGEETESGVPMSEELWQDPEPAYTSLDDLEHSPFDSEFAKLVKLLDERTKS